jgi:hypothetical protein
MHGEMESSCYIDRVSVSGARVFRVFCGAVSGVVKFAASDFLVRQLLLQKFH